MNATTKRVIFYVASAAFLLAGYWFSNRIMSHQDKSQKQMDQSIEKMKQYRGY